MSELMFDMSVPQLIRGFRILDGYMNKGQAFAETKGIDPSALLGSRLSLDMLTPSAQIQRASDKAKNGVARLTGSEAPSFSDTEQTFTELKERIAKTVRYLETYTPEMFVGAKEREVQLRFRSVTGATDGYSYLTKFMLPDFYFHIATAHGIMRHNGVEIGKSDYLGGID